MRLALLNRLRTVTALAAGPAMPGPPLSSSASDEMIYHLTPIEKKVLRAATRRPLFRGKGGWRPAGEYTNTFAAQAVERLVALRLLKREGHVVTATALGHDVASGDVKRAWWV